MDVSNTSGFGRRRRVYSDDSVQTLRVDDLSGPDDVPTPCEWGAFDRDVWVCRDPVDVLVLQHLGISAVALATPRASLGRLDYLDQLASIDLLTPRNQPAGRIIISDRVSSPGETWGPVLSNHFAEVIELPSGPGGWNDLTGSRLIEFVMGAKLKGDNIRFKIEDRLAGIGERFESGRSLLGFAPGWSGPALTEADIEANAQSALDTPYQPKPLALIPANELATMSDQTPWLAEPFVAARAITDLHGPAKDGKTTFLLALAAAVAQGTEFLGRRCEKAPVIYVSEQTAGTLNKSASRALALVDGLHVLTVESTFGRQLGEIAPFLRAECRRLGARLVIIDTLGSVAGLGGDADNQSGVARDIYRVLRGFSVDGVAVVVVRHSRKARGSITQTAAGSVAFSGEADQLVRFMRPTENSDVRTVEVVGRLSDSEALTVRFEDHKWVVLEKDQAEAAGMRQGRPKVTKAVDAVWRVLQHVGAQGATPDEAALLAASTGGFSRALSPGSVLNHLRGFVRAGTAMQEPGKNSDVARYWIKQDGDSGPDAPGRPSTGLTLIHSSSPP